jgi:hypothetical protein
MPFGAKFDLKFGFFLTGSRSLPCCRKKFSLIWGLLPIKETRFPVWRMDRKRASPGERAGLPFG